MQNSQTTPQNAPSFGAALGTSLGLGLLHAVLNQVDYGLAVVDADTRVLLFANTQALNALNPQAVGLCGLQLLAQQVLTRNATHAAQLHEALARTKLGQRGLLSLSTSPPEAGGQDGTVAVMPLSALLGGSPASGPQTAPCDGAAAPAAYALLAFAKQQLCDTTSVTLYARERGLTGAEGQVLAQVCKGLRAQEIATHQGVQVSTVRTQLRSIRQKTACDSIRDLVERISVLPPLARQLTSQWGGLEHEPMAFG